MLVVVLVDFAVAEDLEGLLFALGVDVQRDVDGLSDAVLLEFLLYLLGGVFGHVRKICREYALVRWWPF